MIDQQNPDQQIQKPPANPALPAGVQPYNPQAPTVGATVEPFQSGPPTIENGGLMNSVGSPPSAPATSPQVTPPATIPPPPVPAAPGTFNSGSNLIGTQIGSPAPTATPQNTNYGTGQIAERAPISTADTARMTTLGTQQDSAVSNLTGGPNRTALALQTLQDFDTAGQPALMAGFRQVGQQAAKFGRIGAGMTTNDLTGLQGTYDRNKLLLQNDLARSVAEGDINDRFRMVDSLSGLRNNEAGYQNQNFNQNFANRGYGTSIDQYNQGASFDRARAGNQDESQWQDRLYSQNRAGADDLRGERSYQYGLSQDAQESAIRQRMLEDSLLNSAQGRALNQYNAGNANDPSGLYRDFAGNQDATAASLYGNAGQLFGNLGERTAPKPPAVDYQTLFQEFLKSMRPAAGG